MKLAGFMIAVLCIAAVTARAEVKIIDHHPSPSPPRLNCLPTTSVFSHKGVSREVSRESQRCEALFHHNFRDANISGR
jgi:hypothetical protein